MDMTQTIFGVLCPRLRSLLPVNDLSSPRVFNILLRLTEQQLLRRLRQVLLTTVFFEHADPRRISEFLLLLLIRLVKELALSWVGI